MGPHSACELSVPGHLHPYRDKLCPPYNHHQTQSPWTAHVYEFSGPCLPVRTGSRAPGQALPIPTYFLQLVCAPRPLLPAPYPSLSIPVFCLISAACACSLHIPTCSALPITACSLFIFAHPYFLLIVAPSLPIYGCSLSAGALLTIPPRQYQFPPRPACACPVLVHRSLLPAVPAGPSRALTPAGHRWHRHSRDRALLGSA